jgi:hypothetical protein
MVPDSRTESGHYRLRPLNEPQSIVVELGSDGLPAFVMQHNCRYAVDQILDTWRIDDEWWREEPVSRFYWMLALEDGRPMTVFHDLLANQWWRQSY